MYRLQSLVLSARVTHTARTASAAPAVGARPPFVTCIVASSRKCTIRSYSGSADAAPQDDPNAALVRQLKADMKASMRAKDSVAVTVVRGIISDISYAEKSAKGPPKQYLSLVMAAHKRRQDSIAMFQAAKRADLVEKEQAELAVIERYMPKVLTEEQVHLGVVKLCESLDVKSKKDMGKFMAAVNADKELGLVDKKVLVALFDRYLAGKQ